MTLPIGSLGLFSDRWEEITSDSWVKETIRSGLSLEFLSTPPNSLRRCPISRDKTKWNIMETAVQHQLDIQAIEPVPWNKLGHLFNPVHGAKTLGVGGSGEQFWTSND